MIPNPDGGITFETEAELGVVSAAVQSFIQKAEVHPLEMAKMEIIADEIMETADNITRGIEKGELAAAKTYVSKSVGELAVVALLLESETGEDALRSMYISDLLEKYYGQAELAGLTPPSFEISER